MINALTIDVEDYYHVSAFESVVTPQDWTKHESRVERNTHRILDFLDETQTKATFFVLGWVAEQYPQVVRAISQRGHEVASHGYSHRRIYTQTLNQFREETRRSKRMLEDLVGHPILGYRAASYSITAKSLWALNVLVEEGFCYDSSIFPIRHDLYGMPGHNRFSHVLKVAGGAEITELPLSTVRIGPATVPVAGGGYLRLFPCAFTLWAIRHLNDKEKQPAIVYFHPWEIDPNQPRIQAPLKSTFRHYTNLSRMEAKLRRLLSNFSFAPMRDVFKGSLKNHVL